MVLAEEDSSLVDFGVHSHYKEPLPTRGVLLSSLREDVEFDVLVIGGGATGSGVALDACTRGT